jgi:hypothetical protein
MRFACKWERWVHWVGGGWEKKERGLCGVSRAGVKKSPIPAWPWVKSLVRETLKFSFLIDPVTVLLVRLHSNVLRLGH